MSVPDANQLVKGNSLAVKLSSAVSLTICILARGNVI